MRGREETYLVPGLDFTAGLLDVFKLLLDNLSVLAFGNTVPEVDDAGRNLRGVLPEGAKKFLDKLQDILGGDDLNTMAVGVANGGVAGSLHYREC